MASNLDTDAVTMNASVIDSLFLKIVPLTNAVNYIRAFITKIPDDNKKKNKSFTGHPPNKYKLLIGITFQL